MSAIEDSINNLKTRISNAYDAAEAKGAVMPESRKAANLANCINSIELTDWASLGNELLRAEAYSKTVDTSNQFIFIGNDNQYQIMNASSVSYVGGSATVIIDGNIYTYNPTENIITQNTSSNDIVKGVGGNHLIKTDGYLYYYYNRNFYQIMYVGIDGVNKLERAYYIYNGSLYKSNLSSSGYSLVDNEGVWSDIISGGDNNTVFGLRDGLLFRYYNNNPTQITTGRVKMIKESFEVNHLYFVYDSTPNKLHRCTRSSTGTISLELFGTFPSNIVKIFPVSSSNRSFYVLCEDGNIYTRKNASTATLVSNPFIDAYNNTYVYDNQIKTLKSTISNISGASIIYEETSYYSSCVRLAPNSTHTYLRFGTSNATKSYATVTGNDPQNTTLSGNTMTYNNMLLTRDTSKDGVFTFYPNDLKNKTWTDYEMITNAINASLHQNYR